MENRNNTNSSQDSFPDIEYLDDVEFENDITLLENSKNKKTSKGKNGGKNSKKKGKKKKGYFKKGLLIYATVLLAIIACVWTFFYSFIDGYEKGMSYHKIAEITKELKENPEKLLKDTRINTEFEGDGYAVNYIKSLISGKDVTYREAKENTTADPVYELVVDKKVFAKISLKEDGKIKHGFKNWAIKDINVADYLPKTAAITVSAPENSQVYVNDVIVNDSYITDKSVSIDILSNVEQYLANPPKMVKYEIKGLFETPTVKVKDSDGNELEVVENAGNYTAGVSKDASLEEEFKQYLLDVTNAYARNFANLDKSIFNYVRPGSELYDAINSATTYFYPNSKISGTEFTSREITDYVKYSDDCFTCHIKYDYTIYFTGYSIEKDVSSVDMTWVFVKKDGLWYLTDTKYYDN